MAENVIIVMFGTVGTGIVSSTTYINFTKINLDDNVLLAKNYPYYVRYAFFTLSWVINTHTDTIAANMEAVTM